MVTSHDVADTKDLRDTAAFSAGEHVIGTDKAGVEQFAVSARAGESLVSDRVDDGEALRLGERDIPAMLVPDVNQHVDALAICQGGVEWIGGKSADHSGFPSMPQTTRYAVMS